MFDNNDAMLDRLRALSIDLVVVDCHALMDHAYLIAHSLGVPWVTLTGAVQPCNVRVPYLPSFVPNNLVPFSERMNFVERFINVFVNGAFKAYVGLGELPEHVLVKCKQS